MSAKYLLGIDIGSSSVKTALLNVDTGQPAGAAFSPNDEMPMISTQPGFAEQDPDRWWSELINSLALLRKNYPFKAEEIAAIGISYQMHGLVCIDKNNKPVRHSIIWCDSRAVDIGNKAFRSLGEEFCLTNFLNSPGNFTASKFKWVKDNEPEVFHRVHKILLPGDYIALKLTGEPFTTVPGLSEGIMWNFSKNKVATELLDQYEINRSVVSDVVNTFSVQGTLSVSAAEILNLKPGTPVSYRAGDQPNNAFSLNVLQPGEIAATAGTSGVVYGVTDKVEYDRASRVNTFVHVNHSNEKPRYGILLCINGTGILNSWLKKNFFNGTSYNEMNNKAAQIKPGCEGLFIYPFGNGTERVLENRNNGASIRGLQFNNHHQGHIARAAQEGIVFSLYYGISIMKEMGMQVNKVRAGYSNMFLSETFAEAFANTANASLELYDTDGATGAARAAGVGAGIYKSFNESFEGMKKIKTIEPSEDKKNIYNDLYIKWKEGLNKIIN
ncbi:MAG TPA: FGGY family carbohydrate kinase [Flavitalea sp.]|nr:FGGY family carbohydrate kinase [Flavitalea sp.]